MPHIPHISHIPHMPYASCLNRFYPGKILEWNLGFCLFNQMYNDQFQVREKENTNPVRVLEYVG